jgi:hypothetical protein
MRLGSEPSIEEDGNMRHVILTMFLLCSACMDSSSPPAQQQAASTVCGGQLYDGCTSDDQCESR